MKKLSLLLILCICMIISGCTLTVDINNQETTSQVETQETDYTTQSMTTTQAETTATEKIESTSEQTQAKDVNESFKSYIIRVTNPQMNIYDLPNGAVNRSFGEVGSYTIVQEKIDSYGQKWGKLKSGVGWILLSDYDLYPTIKFTLYEEGMNITHLNLYGDGTFSGKREVWVWDEDSNSSTVTYTFKGKFSNVKALDSLSLTMTLSHVTINGVADGETVKGFEFLDGNEFRIFFPGYTISSIPVDFSRWVPNRGLDEGGNKLPCYALSNISQGHTLFSDW